MRKILVLFTAVFVVALIGCGDNPTLPINEADIQPLASTVTPEIRGLLEQHTNIGAETPTDTPESKSFFPDPSTNDYNVYAVTFLWGHLANHSISSAATTDWSGTLSTNTEALIDLRHIIDFEPEQDSILPTSTPMYVEWVSETGFDIDGLSFRVYLKRGNTSDVAPLLVFGTQPITLRLPFHILDDYIAYYPVNNGQGVAVLARRIWPGSCPQGAMRGKWNWDDNTNTQGKFNGLWLDDDGNITGLYNGLFWTNNDGTREFSGWVSGYYTDQVIAEFKGRWWFDDPRLCPTCGDDHGLFFGKVRWLDNSDDKGLIKGHFGDLTSATDQAALPMVGVWRMICPCPHISVTSPSSW